MKVSSDYPKHLRIRSFVLPFLKDSFSICRYLWSTAPLTDNLPSVFVINAYYGWDSEKFYNFYAYAFEFWSEEWDDEYDPFLVEALELDVLIREWKILAMASIYCIFISSADTTLAELFGILIRMWPVLDSLQPSILFFISSPSTLYKNLEPCCCFLPILWCCIVDYFLSWT